MEGPHLISLLFPWQQASCLAQSSYSGNIERFGLFNDATFEHPRLPSQPGQESGAGRVPSLSSLYRKEHGRDREEAFLSGSAPHDLEESEENGLSANYLTGL